MSVLTHKIRIKVRTRRQRKALETALRVSCTLYNAALEERSSAWRRGRIRISKRDQEKSITALAGDPSLAGLPVNLLRWPLAKLDLAYQGFFARCKAGRTPGHPRYRAAERWDTFGYTDRQCWKIVATEGRPDRARLELSRIGTFPMRLHRPIDGVVHALQVKREGRKWFALLAVEVEDAATHPRADLSVGVDVGTTHLATLSTGERLANPRVSRCRAARIAEAQRALARGRKGSKRRGRLKQRLGALRRAEANARSTHLHQRSAELARRFGTIVFEDLRIANMTRSAAGTVEEPGSNVRQKAGLNRSILDAGWGRLIALTAYKAARAGGRVVRVNARHSSNECHRCHAITQTRIGDPYRCPRCGLDMDRDHNAALVIRHRGVVAPRAEAA